MFGGEWEQIKDTFVLAAGDRHEVADVGGSETVTLIAGNIPPHTHGVNLSASSGAHRHKMGTDANRYAVITSDNKTGADISSGIGGGDTYKYPRALASESFSKRDYTDTDGNHTHSMSGTTGSSGSGTAHNNMPPYITAYCWKRIA